MAEILDHFEFTNRRNRKDKHPWDEWFDGKIRKLEQGEDFKGAATNFRRKIYEVARTRGVTVQTRQIDDTHIVVQAMLND